jgi:hypothetical protein
MGGNIYEFPVSFSEKELGLVESVMTEFTQSNEGHTSPLTEEIVYVVRQKLAGSRQTPSPLSTTNIWTFSKSIPNTMTTFTGGQTITIVDAKSGLKATFITSTTTSTPFQAGNLNDLLTEINGYSSNGVKWNVIATLNDNSQLVITDASGTTAVFVLNSSTQTDLGTVILGSQ